MNSEARAGMSDPRQRRAVRRTAALLALVAFAIYASFILYSVTHGHK